MTQSPPDPPQPLPANHSRIRAWVFASAILVLLVGAIGIFIADRKSSFNNQPGPLAEETTILVERGLSVRQVAAKLEEARVIDDAWLFEVGVRFFADKKPIKAGEFSIPPAATMAGVLETLQTANPVQYRMLIREGITVSEALDIVRADDRLVGEIEGTYEEGRLLPDTYYFVRGEARDVLLKRMAKALDTVLAEAWDTRTDKDNLQTPEELLVMASIIEKETSRDREKHLVSGVFHNRLSKGMRLQSDPTVIYGIAQGPLGRSLKRKDVTTATPYNTYTIDGLPPGPIALSSKASIMAAGQPAETEALFFVVDGNGGHVFAKTYAEHRRNIKKWLDARRARRAKKAQ
ncbi:MAG: endolytic transglycosylase MltG [Sphingomonadales bacterium]